MLLSLRPSMLAWLRMEWVAACRLAHHCSGSCSAHPFFLAMISISCLGEKSLATHIPVCASTSEALTDELPMSYPNKYILFCFYIVIFRCKDTFF